MTWDIGARAEISVLQFCGNRVRSRWELGDNHRNKQDELRVYKMEQKKYTMVWRGYVRVNWERFDTGLQGGREAIFWSKKVLKSSNHSIPYFCSIVYPRYYGHLYNRFWLLQTKWPLSGGNGQEQHHQFIMNYVHYFHCLNELLSKYNATHDGICEVVGFLIMLAVSISSFMYHFRYNI